MKKAFLLSRWLVCLALTGVVSCQTTRDPAPIPTTPSGLSEHLTLGNPSGATADPTQPANYLLAKSQYALSYHRDQGKPNWVSWHLDTSWLGSAARQDDFRADPDLPAGWYQDARLVGAAAHGEREG